jgi:hypothetical protein
MRVPETPDFLELFSQPQLWELRSTTFKVRMAQTLRYDLSQWMSRYPQAPVPADSVWTKLPPKPQTMFAMF